MGGYTDVVVLPLGGRCRTIDRCIHHLVAALNAAGVETVACCCGHGKQLGSIALADGRELVIAPDRATAERLIRASSSDPEVRDGVSP